MSFADDGYKCRCQKPWYKAGIRRDGYKCQKHIHKWDARLRKIFPHGMRDEVDLKMSFSIGFEKFAAYEDWGQGWNIESETVRDKLGNVHKVFSYGHNYIDEAMEEFLKKAEAICEIP